MCRLLAYMGPEINLYNLILKPSHSLEKQAWSPKELKETKLNVDGFGFAWFKSNGEPALYRQSYPIWNDANLKDLSQTLKQKFYFAMVRSATAGLQMSVNNTQPFYYKDWLFQHNGYIQDFARDFRVQMRHLLNNKYENIIQGNTDSEYIFALLMQYIEKTNDPIEALKLTFNDIKQLIKTKPALLNIMLSDGDTIIASKYALNGECPSLYYGHSINEFPDNSQLLVSEPLNNDDHWLAIKDQSFLVIRNNQQVKIINL